MPLRSPSAWRATLAPVLFVGLAATSAAAGAASAPPLPPSPVIDANDFVSEHTQVEWSERYLQWVASFPRGSSPVSDTTGALCAVRQEGDVWFLATSDGTAPVTRACAVPSGRTLFVPIAQITERSGNREPACDSMARVAAGSLVQHVGELSLEIDGVPVAGLASHRLATGDCFAPGLRQVPRSPARTAVADGWYVMLQPLAAGPHTLVIGARFDSTALSVTYKLEVR
jgi:hypothetical protein